MATVTLHYDSPHLTLADKPSDSRAELVYDVTGATSDGNAQSAVLAASPIYYNGMPRQSVTTEPQGNGVYRATASYQLRDSEPAGYSSYEFETSGGSQHITLSKQTTAWGIGPGTPPLYRGAIGVTDDSVEGCDIVVPVYQFSERHIIHSSFVTGAYKANLYFLTGRICNASFRGFNRGEVLFMGAQGSKRGYDDWEISFKFAASPDSVIPVDAGDHFVPVTKKGWDYFWVRFVKTIHPEANKVVQRPTACYTERVYDYGDFSLIGIGTTG